MNVLVTVTLAPMEQSPNRLWEKLLDYVEERRVIPVIGSELLAGTRDEAGVYRIIADRVAAKFGIPTEGLPADYSLNEVVCRYPSAAEPLHKDDLYREVRSVIEIAAAGAAAAAARSCGDHRLRSVREPHLRFVPRPRR